VLPSAPPPRGSSERNRPASVGRSVEGGDPVGSASADRAGHHGVKSSPRRTIALTRPALTAPFSSIFSPEKYTPFPFLPCRDTRTGWGVSVSLFPSLSLRSPSASRSSAQETSRYSRLHQRDRPLLHTATGRHLFPSGCPAGHLIGEPPIDSTFHPGLPAPSRLVLSQSFSAAAYCRHAENHRARGLSPPRVGGGIRHPSSSKGRTTQHSRPAIAASVECAATRRLISSLMHPTLSLTL
jgi:hypothetical protein